jgi:hypothetical protein
VPAPQKACTNRNGKSNNYQQSLLALQKLAAAIQPARRCVWLMLQDERTRSEVHLQAQPTAPNPQLVRWIHDAIGKQQRKNEPQRHSHDGCANADRSPPELRRAPVKGRQ